MKIKTRRISPPTLAVLQYFTIDPQCLKQWASHVPGLEQTCNTAQEVLDGAKTERELIIEKLAERQRQVFTDSCPIPAEGLCAALLKLLIDDIDWQTLAEFVVDFARVNTGDGIAACINSTCRFISERIVVTNGAATMLDREEIDLAVTRHFGGDWGNVPDEDREANERGLASGGRLMSAFGDGGKRVWVITEADRSATTVLLPEEY